MRTCAAGQAGGGESQFGLHAAAGAGGGGAHAPAYAGHHRQVPAGPGIHSPFCLNQLGFNQPRVSSRSSHNRLRHSKRPITSSSGLLMVCAACHCRCLQLAFCRLSAPSTAGKACDHIAMRCAAAAAGACCHAACACGGVHCIAAGGRGGRGPRFPHLCARCSNSLLHFVVTSRLQVSIQVAGCWLPGVARIGDGQPGCSFKGCSAGSACACSIAACRVQCRDLMLHAGLRER